MSFQDTSKFKAGFADDADIDMEDEANAFAFELLMPEKFMRAEVAKLGGVDIDDEQKVRKLAQKFRVTNNVMVLRLGQLSRGLGGK